MTNKIATTLAKTWRVIGRIPRMTSDALAWLGGANLTILAKAPTTRGKFVQMGLVLLTTASIAAVAMTFFIRQEVKEPESTGLLLGICWGLVILNLDRYLVVSMGATRDKRRLMLMAAPRLCLAIVISLAISTPITLRIFQSDINYQLQISQASESANLNNLEARSGLATQANQLAAEISADQAIMDGSLPHSVTSVQLQTAQQQVAKLQPEVSAAKQQEINAYEAWQCELYGDGTGCADASNRPGQGPIADAKEATYNQDVSNYNGLAAQLQTALANESTAQASLKQAQATATTRYQSQASAALPGLQAKYNRDEKEIAAAEAADQTTVNQNTGTLAQLSALWSASSGSIVLMLAHLTIMALFFLIELLPVLVKILLNLGPLDAYEKVLKAEEDKLADKLRADRVAERRDTERVSNERRQTEDAAAKARVAVAEDRSEREKDLGIKANEYVADKMAAILDAALQQWSGQVTATLNNAQGSGTQAGGGASPPNARPAANGGNASGNAAQPQGQPPQYGPPQYRPPQYRPVPQNGPAPQNGSVPQNGSSPTPAQGFGLIPPGNTI